MKKLVFGAALACCLLLTGCAQTLLKDKIAEGTVTELPTLTVQAGGETVEAKEGSYTWEYDWGIGSSTKEKVTTAHALERKEFIPTLTTAEKELTLSFSEGCDSFTVQRWSDAYWDQPEAEAEEVTVAENALTLLPRGYIYEITAEWTSAQTHRGTAEYAIHVTVTE